MTNIEKSVKQVVEPIINNLGYKVYDVIYEKEGQDNYLRIFIDKDKTIDLNDCEKVNDAIMEDLDKADYIKEQYFLEVSSPGIEKVLRKDKHLSQNIGNEIYVKLFKKDENSKKEYQGILKQFNKETITITNEEEIVIERKNIAQIKTVYNWEEGE